MNEQIIQPIISQYYHSNDGHGHSFIYGPINDLDSIAGSLHPIVENPRTFKPPKPKENTRPRINKLTTPQENSTRLFKHPITDIGEYSIDELKQLFLNHLHMIEPTNKLSSFSANLKNEIEYQMFNYFVNNLSSQLDVFFEVKVYSEIVSQMALYDDSGILLQSVFCLSSLMLHRMMPDKIDASLPIKYYHHSIKTIKSYLDMFNHDMGVCSKCLLATTLLSVYEFYFTSIEDIYTGNAASILASIIQSDNSRNKSSPLLDSVFLATCFWSVFTLGFIQSLKNVRVNIYSVDLFWKALDSEYFTVFDKYMVLTEASEPKTTLSKTETVWWFRKTILICSQISDFKGEVNVPTQQDVEQNQSFKKWIELKDILVDFENKAPDGLFPVIYHSNSDSGAFPTIFFKDELSTLIGINRALAKLLLFESLLVKTNIQAREVRDELSKFPPGYEKKLAKDLIGIIKCYDSNSTIWPLNLHVLGYVQAYLADEEQAINEMSPLITKLSKVCNLNI
ncbi:uncharacterized protein SPAPADRAFT_149038 [Spathaspora passalidarum NRRL Y-27907]|uniref:Transcription factor domain-containing protein n=1 Tax=Spathaspora passalidarum (strain NRRL Y-27907 / 11-Y1) TaxID=619300 RepID=G3AI10_SPAPN|nr:uncharacterized protein SPAPADRAFT_149038 [Spathaspora passalidarum NRRL Y-27907]EGW34323.1 hypothetical protein SPAPADRAFT_149038 [Spathaspora passalidarum NRRL Y-27907]